MRTALAFPDPDRSPIFLAAPVNPGFQGRIDDHLNPTALNRLWNTTVPAVVDSSAWNRSARNVCWSCAAGRHECTGHCDCYDSGHTLLAVN